MGNPAIFPLIYGCDSRDVLVVHINAIERPTLPRTATEIFDRINEISFNSSLMREMRAIAFAAKLIDEGRVASDTMKQMLIHDIEAPEAMLQLGAISKLNADWGQISSLMELGRDRVGEWLDANFDRLGKESTVDIRAKYL